jgi:hypothetical protein
MCLALSVAVQTEVRHRLARGEIMKTRTFMLALAATAAIASGPQLAHAACSGDACNSLSFDGVTVTNKDWKNGMVIGVCFAEHNGPNYGTCGNSPRIEEFTLAPQSSVQVRTRQLEIRKVTVELRTAKFIPSLSAPRTSP